MAQGFPLQILLDRANEISTRRPGSSASPSASAPTRPTSSTRCCAIATNITCASQSAQSGMPAGNWRNFQAFLDTLDSAIAQQRRVLAAAEARIDEARPHWQQQKRTVGSYEILQARGVAQEARRTAKREQREADEHAAKILRMRADAAKST